MKIREIVSSIKTPKEYIDTDQNGIEYIKTPYMRYLADKYYPGWGFKAIEPAQIIKDEHNKPAFVIVTLELQWSEWDDDIQEFINRVGAMSAAHRIQYTKPQTRTVDPSNNKQVSQAIKDGFIPFHHSPEFCSEWIKTKILDPGNDVKAANTDCAKKAFNFYLHIGDDIYRFENPNISQEEKEEYEKILKELNKDSPFAKEETQFLVNRKNYRLNKIAKQRKLEAHGSELQNS